MHATTESLISCLIRKWCLFFYEYCNNFQLPFSKLLYGVLVLCRSKMYALYFIVLRSKLGMFHYANREMVTFLPYTVNRRRQISFIVYLL